MYFLFSKFYNARFQMRGTDIKIDMIVTFINSLESNFINAENELSASPLIPLINFSLNPFKNVSVYASI